MNGWGYGVTAAIIGLFMVGCAEDGEGSFEGSGETNSDLECSGHGHLHGDHCDCEDGYAVDESSCIAVSALPVCGADEAHDHDHDHEAKSSEAHDHDEEEEHDHDEDHDHAEPCRCENPVQACSCAEGTESAAYGGMYYCASAHHHEE